MTFFQPFLDNVSQGTEATPSPPVRRRLLHRVRQARHIFVDDLAAHSGSETSSGEDDGSEGTVVAPEQAASPTSSPPAQIEGYHLMSLLSQPAPGAPVFSAAPVRARALGPSEALRMERPSHSQASTRSDASSNVSHYDIGSFVVNDDDEGEVTVSTFFPLGSAELTDKGAIDAMNFLVSMSRSVFGRPIKISGV